MTLTGPTSAVGQGKEEQIENMRKTLQKEHEKQIKALKEQIVQVKQDHEQITGSTKSTAGGEDWKT